jgi:hypothetical protein
MRLLHFESLEPRQLLAADAVDDEYFESPTHGARILDVLANDSGENIEIVSFTQGSLGGYVFYYEPLPGERDVLRYVPPPVFNATETFTYTITDGTPGSEDSATVAVHLGNEFVLGHLPTGFYPYGITVPGELTTRITSFHDPDPTLSHTAVVRWNDGLVVEAVVTESSNVNGVDGFISLWRTIPTYGQLYEGILTLRSSDGTERTDTVQAYAMTVVLRPDHIDTLTTKSTLVIGGFDNVADQILLVPAVGGKKMVAPFVVEDVAGEPSMRLYYNGADMGTFIADHILIYGQGGNDLIQVDAGITADAQLFGQAGNDILVGGSGNDILVGGVGDDILYGFNGRDLLFGGLGRDFLQGASWNGSATAGDGDLLIGSYVSFDNDITLLNQLATLWQTGDPYGTRVATIRASSPRLQMNETVFDDWSLDYVFGAGDLDWFWVEPTRDNFDAQGDETVN